MKTKDNNLDPLMRWTLAACLTAWGIVTALLILSDPESLTALAAHKALGIASAAALYICATKAKALGMLPKF